MLPVPQPNARANKSFKCIFRLRLPASRHVQA